MFKSIKMQNTIMGIGFLCMIGGCSRREVANAPLGAPQNPTVSGNLDQTAATDASATLTPATGSVPIPDTSSGQPVSTTSSNLNSGSVVSISTIGAPSARYTPFIVWDQVHSKFIVWGGGGCQRKICRDGGMYDPKTNTWTPISSELPNTPAESQSRFLWTGSELIVWNGRHHMPQFGALFNPSGPSWTTINPYDAAGNFLGTAVWTGTKMITWGGWSYRNGSEVMGKFGSRWTRSSNTWEPMHTEEFPDSNNNKWAPEGRTRNSAVWTGTHMIVWGGYQEVYINGQLEEPLLNDGAAYNPSNDTWTKLPTKGAPTARAGHYAWVVGKKMYIWGGCGNGTTSNAGAVFDFSSGIENGTWSAMPTKNAPAPRWHEGWEDHSQLTSNNNLMVYGGRLCGDGDLSVLPDGAIYDTTKNTWTKIWTNSGIKTRYQSSVAWAPSIGKLLYFGGYLSKYPLNNPPLPVNSGYLLSLPSP